MISLLEVSIRVYSSSRNKMILYTVPGNRAHHDHRDKQLFALVDSRVQSVCGISRTPHWPHRALKQSLSDNLASLSD